MKPTLPPTAKLGIPKPNRSGQEMSSQRLPSFAMIAKMAKVEDWLEMLSTCRLGTERSLRIGIVDIFERSGSDSIVSAAD